MTQEASLSLGIDTENLLRGINALDGVADASRKASAAADGMASGMRSGAQGASLLGAEARKTVSGVNSLGLSADAARGAVNSAGKEWVRASSMAGKLRMEALGAAAANNKLAQSSVGAGAAASKMASDAQRAAQASHIANKATVAHRMGLQQLGMQLSDVSTMYAGGARAAQIFATQSGQILQSVQLMMGGTSKAAAFLSGPWGMAIQIGALALVPLIGKLFESSDAMSEGEKKAKESAAAHETLADKLDLARHSFNEVTQAAAEYNAEQRKSNQLAIDGAKAAYEKAKANMTVALALRGVYAIELERAQQAASASRGAMIGEGTAEMSVAFAEDAAQTSKLIKDNALSIRTLQGAIDNTKFDVAKEQAKINSDPGKALEVKYERQRQAVRATNASLAEQSRLLTKINREEDAAQKALSDSQRTRRGRADSTYSGSGISFDNLVRAVIKQESGGNHNAVSPVGARGMMQIMPATGRSPGYGITPLRDGSVGENIRFGKDYLAAMLRTYSGNVPMALAAYNWGAGKVDAYTKRVGDPRSGAISNEKWATNIPVKETRDYVRKIMSNARSPGNDLIGQLDNLAEQAAEAAKRQAEELQRFGEKAVSEIERVSQAFGEQPTAIEKAIDATRDLDQTIAELGAKQPPGFEQMIASAQAAKKVVEDSLNRPFAEMNEQARTQMQVQRLILAGREDEASALQRIYDLQRQGVAVSEQHRQEILDNLAAERDINEALEKRQAIMGEYRSFTDGIRSDLESLLGGTGGTDIFKNLHNSFKQMRGKELTEKLFGDSFKEIDRWTKEQTAIDAGIDIFTEGTGRAGREMVDFATRLKESGGNVVAALNSTASGIVAGKSGGIGAAGGAPVTLAANPASITASKLTGGAQKGALHAEALAIAAGLGGPLTAALNDNQEALAEIVVNGKKAAAGLAGTKPESFIKMTSNVFAQNIAGQLNTAFKTQFFDKFTGAIAGGFEGYAKAGGVGAVLGVGQGYFADLAQNAPKGSAKATGYGKISGKFGTALGGAQVGETVADLGKLVGLKTSKVGGQIGGAVGALTGIPGGSFIGSVLGSLFGGLFVKTKQGAAVVSGMGNASLSGSDKDRRAAAGTLAGGVQSGLKSIAEQLGATIGGFNLAIGTYKDKFRVSTNGSTNFKKVGGTVYSFDTEAEAIEFAIRDALSDGALKGISQASTNILRAGGDIEKALEKALMIESLPKTLKQRLDPLGYALDEINSKYTKLTSALTEGSATSEQWANAEKLYNLEREDALKQFGESAATLKEYLKSLALGSNSPLSLRNQYATAAADFAKFEEQIAAGKTIDQEAYTRAAQQYLDISRSMNASSLSYFADYEKVKMLTDTAITDITAKQAAPTAPLDVFAQQTASNTNDMVKLMADNNALLKAINDNMMNGGYYPIYGSGSEFMDQNRAFA